MQIAIPVEIALRQRKFKFSLNHTVLNCFVACLENIDPTISRLSEGLKVFVRKDTPYPSLIYPFPEEENTLKVPSQGNPEEILLFNLNLCKQPLRRSFEILHCQFQLLYRQLIPANICI